MVADPVARPPRADSPPSLPAPLLASIPTSAGKEWRALAPSLARYQLRLPTFEGPLDLLLGLIDKRRLDITTLSLATVTDQYMEQLRERKSQGYDPESLSEFVVVASKLILIKSVALLPRPERQSPDEPLADPTDLTARLIEYERYRQVTVELRLREELELRSYPNQPLASTIAPEIAQPIYPPIYQIDEPTSLLRAILSIRHKGEAKPRPRSLPRESWPLTRAIVWLRESLGRGGRPIFNDLIAGLSAHRTVGAFLSLLELTRLGEARVVQRESYGPIEIEIERAGASPQ